MNTSNLSFDDLQIPEFKTVLEYIDQVLNQYGIPYYLIGVNAISLEFLKKGYRLPRATKDIDLALMLSTLRDYEKVIKALEAKGFSNKQAPWRLIHKELDVMIDLLPFGEIEQEDEMGFKKRFSNLHVTGFREVMEEANEVRIEDKTIRIPPLEGMILLKLIAWSDRPEKRENDLTDILHVIEQYNELEFEANMNEHYDAVPLDDEFDDYKFSCRILGRKAEQILTKSDSLYRRIMKLLEDNASNPEHSGIAKRWAREEGWSLEYGVELLEAFRTGIRDKLTKGNSKGK